MRSSPTTGQIDLAMAAVQSELIPVGKNKSVEVDGAKAKWESKFTTFEALHEACHASLAKHGVAVYQGGEVVQGSGERLVTRLACKGEWIESSFPIKTSRDGAQGFGGGISFAKRWGLCGMVGLVPTDNAEERTGYTDERPASKARQRAPLGIAPALAAIRNATAHADFIAAAMTARSVFPTEPEVERTIAGWMISAFSNSKTVDEFTILRDLGKEIRTRGGSELMDVIRQTEARLMGGK
jgi:hypothetical protein